MILLLFPNLSCETLNPPPPFTLSASLLCSHCSAPPQTPSTYLPTYVSVCPSLSVCLPLCQSVCADVCLCVDVRHPLYLSPNNPGCTLVLSQVEIKSLKKKERDKTHGSSQYVRGHTVSHSSILAIALNKCKNKEKKKKAPTNHFSVEKISLKCGWV